MNLYKITVTSCYGEAFVVTVYAAGLVEAVESVETETDWNITNIETVA